MTPINANNRLTRMLLIGLALWTSGVVRAEQLRVSAPVIAAEPVYAAARSHCDVAAPGHQEGLGAVLQWDLQDRCRVEPGGERIVHWRVRYQWDGRTFTVTTKHKPAEQIPIVLTLN